MWPLWAKGPPTKDDSRYKFLVQMLEAKVSCLHNRQWSVELPVNSAHSGNLTNHWCMNWTQFKDPVSHICLAGAVVASWSLTQEVASSSPSNDKYFLWQNSLNSVRKKIVHYGLCTKLTLTTFHFPYGHWEERPRKPISIHRMLWR